MFSMSLTVAPRRGGAAMPFFGCGHFVKPSEPSLRAATSRV